MNDDYFHGKLAVITGGASGVGRSLAFALGRRGAAVSIGDVDEVALSDTEAALHAEGITALTQHCDVSSPESLQALAEATLAAHDNGIDIVFANAGISAGETGKMWEYSMHDWHWCLNVNMWGPIHCINTFMPILIEQSRPAHFSITGSGNGAFLVYPDAPIYTISKAAVQAITEGLHYQCMDTQVKVHALFPGPHVVETGLFNSSRVRPAEFAKASVSDKNESGISSVEDMKRVSAEHGIELETTHPDQVAANALRCMERGDFWMMETTPETDEKIERHHQMIMRRRNPVPELVGN